LRIPIEGVTTVIDAGLARVARFDPHRGINTLLVEKISVASAEQRAGRAGRTAPGLAVRLWTEREHAQRAPQELPEVKRLDLSEVVLTLKASGITDVSGFPWLEKPDAKSLERAEALLADLGAIGGTGDRSAETGNRGPETGDWGPENGSRVSEFGNRIRETRNRGPEVGSPVVGSGTGVPPVESIPEAGSSESHRDA